MRIIAGSLGGRQFSEPKSDSVRPMSEKVRGALFDIIAGVEGKAVLDVYAGSGALGFEALSRGASKVVAIEKQRAVTQIIFKSAKALELTNYFLISGSAEKEVARLGSFDVVLADPPYAEIDPNVLNQLGRLLTEKGIMVVSHSSRMQPPEIQSVKHFDTRVYGDSALSFYQN